MGLQIGFEHGILLMRVVVKIGLVSVSRFFQKYTKMNFAENKNMRSSSSLHRPVCNYVGGYMREKKKNLIQNLVLPTVLHSAVTVHSGKDVQLAWAPLLGGASPSAQARSQAHRVKSPCDPCWEPWKQDLKLSVPYLK